MYVRVLGVAVEIWSSYGQMAIVAILRLTSNGEHVLTGYTGPNAHFMVTLSCFRDAALVRRVIHCTKHLAHRNARVTPLQSTQVSTVKVRFVRIRPDFSLRASLEFSRLPSNVLLPLLDDPFE